ncbi:MAG: Rpn family recombination-promoting nuclease/putative transposase [Treponema sp.]|nr:Rpn family recombination-promoting nuclease/putative transposase [Treponema sp.]
MLDFIYNKESSDAVSRYAMRTKSGLELSNSLNVVFVELPKVEKLEQRLDKNTLLENWALFLKDADDPRKRDIIRKLTDKEAGLMQAQKSLSSISADKDFWIAQFRQEIFERDRISSLSAMRKEGLEEGLAQGRKEKAVETARTLLSMRTLTKEQIAKATGLSVEEVESL